MNVGILGAGSWGSALSLVLSHNQNCQISLYHYNNYYDSHNSFKYLNQNIPKNIKITSSLRNFSSLDIIFIALPTEFINTILSEILFKSSSELNNNIIWVNCSKGFDFEYRDRFSTTLIKQFNVEKNNFAILSGPSHAEEVAKQIPTAVVVSSQSEKKANLIQKLLSNNYFRVYTNLDIVGVEVGGIYSGKNNL